MFIKTEILKAITFKQSVRIPLSYCLLVVLRFLLTALPQIGYIHPDEFFQNVEVLAGDVFQIDVARTWEFNPKFPIRNIFVSKMILEPPLQFIRIINPLSKTYLNIDLKTPYYLLVIPRLFICLLSLLNDYCLYKICVLYGQNYINRLKIFASSYVVLVYCCRSFSNSFEVIFFSLLLYLVAECMQKSDKVVYHDEFLTEKYKESESVVEKVKIYKLRTNLPQHSLNKVFILSSLVVIGIFNRPTFVGFAFAPVFFWLHRGMGSKVVGFKDFNWRIFAVIFCGIPSVLLLVLVDSTYYGYLTHADIESLQLTWNNWVVTPLNFLRYNADLQNLIHHGLHPHWLHLVVNIPLLFNVLGLLAIIKLSSHMYKFLIGKYSKLPRIQSITGLMIFSLVVPILVLSLFPHQEARFIIPVILPLVYLFGNYLFTNESDGPGYRKVKNLLLYTWYILNIILTIFFGFIHQAGIYPFANSLYRETKSIYGVQTHVITTHSYSIPTYLLQLESTNRVWKDKKTGHRYRVAPTTFIHKYGSLPMKDLFNNIEVVLNDAERLLHKYNKPYRFYIASPCSLDKELAKEASKYNYFKLVHDVSYYPHFCTEAIPKFPDKKDKLCVENSIPRVNESQNIDLDMYQRVSCYLRRFCLKIYKVKSFGKA